MKASLSAAALLLAAGGAFAQPLTGGSCDLTASEALECTVIGGPAGGDYLPRLDLRSLPAQLTDWRVAGQFAVGPCGRALMSAGAVPATMLTASTALGTRTVRLGPGSCFRATLTCSSRTGPVSCGALAALGATVGLTRR